MFRFASPYFLILLIVVPIIMLFRSRTSVYPHLRISSIGWAKGLPKSFWLSINWLVPFLKFLAIALMIIAMARPQWGTKKTTVQTEGINIILAMDLSESMAALDFKTGSKIINRLEAAKSVILDFITKRSGDRIGLVVFGSHAYTQLPLNRDYNTISSMLARLEIGAAGKATAIGDAIGISIKRLADIKSKSNIIILLTDGSSNSGEIDPLLAADIAKGKNIKVYTVGIGTKGKVPYPINDPIFGQRYIYQRFDIDEETLQAIADKTDGLYFKGEDINGLQKIYETIDRLEKTEVKVKSFADYKEYYHYLLIPAFLCICLWIILANTRFLRIP